VIRDHAAIAQFVREGLNSRIKSQRRSIDDLEQGIKRIEEESDRLRKSDEEARARSTALREEFAEKQTQTPTPQSAGASTADPTAVRLIDQQINQSSEHTSNLVAARTRALLDDVSARSLLDGLAESLANNERSLAMTEDTRVVLPPTPISVPAGPRRFYLLTVAAIASILCSAGAVVWFHKLRLIGRPRHWNAKGVSASGKGRPFRNLQGMRTTREFPRETRLNP
jgi:hypothetical protein